MSSRQHRVALITGGSRGIGFGIARALAREGLALAINGVRPEAEVREALSELRQTGASVCYARGDVSRAEDRDAILDVVRREHGRLDVLVNNAGITSPGRKDILEAEEVAFDRVLGINLKGPFFLTQLAARWMIEQSSAELAAASEKPEKAEGTKLEPAAVVKDEPAADPASGRLPRRCVINVSSISGEFVSTNRGDYCLAKAALRMATKLWAARLAEHRIDVYEIQPGVIRSDMTAGVAEKYDRLIAQGLTLDRRWGETEDVGKAAAMLTRGDLPYATGQVLKIDGGMTIRVL